MYKVHLHATPNIPPLLRLAIFGSAALGILAVVGGVIALIPPGFWSSLTSEETSEEDEGKPAGAGGAP